MLFTRRHFLTNTLAASGLAGMARAQPASQARSTPIVLEAGPNGFNGRSPGPVLRARKGETLHVRLINRLDQPTSIHWRGLRGPNAMDGVAGLTQNAVLPGGSFDYEFTPPDSGTFLFQAHAEPFADAQIRSGLSGLLLVDEAGGAGQYGSEILLALNDGPANPTAAKPVFTLNGAATPVQKRHTSGERLRLRIANISAESIIGLTFSGARPHIAAVDGQPCPVFEPGGRTVVIAPGARFDVLCDMPRQPGRKLDIHATRWPAPGKKADAPERVWSAQSEGEPGPASAPFSPLPANRLLPERIRLQNATRGSIVLGQSPGPKTVLPEKWTFNGISQQDYSGPPLLKARSGTPVVLSVKNKTAWPQVLWLHGHCMRILHRLDDGWQPYWRDTVIMPSGTIIRVAFVAQNRGRWRIGSGIMRRSQNGLQGWIKVE